MIEGFGSVYLTDRSRSRRPVNIRIRIRNSAVEGFYLKNIECVPAPGAQRPEREADGRLCPRGGGQRQAQGGVQVRRKVPDPAPYRYYFLILSKTFLNPIFLQHFS
jgi:hypothetical protein